MVEHRDDNFDVAVSAIHTLSSFAETPDGANSVVSARTLDVVMELIGSPNITIRKTACEMLGKLAKYHDTAAAVIEAIPCTGLLPVLSDNDKEVVESAVFALYEIIQWPEGTQAVVASKILDILWHSQNPRSKEKAAEIERALHAFQLIQQRQRVAIGIHIHSAVDTTVL
ncbi:hypothetical protein B0H19DRAFT_1175520 [Mycena capillaripes]|nr:hypothetical protein B0H19DRAFT_1175520 [Mycena capillaripes]